ncbi:MAG: ribonuclease G [Endozoicomonadaceae bacterium]|nr:ribonuclease G [Endozoicomonadaceae bacterium]
MSEEVLMNIMPAESRVAVVENGVLQEIYLERSCSRGIVGNIYKGKVVRVLPGMQAAFVDIGLDKAAFIHVREIASRDYCQEAVTALDIVEFAQEGQSMVVQVTKESLGTKGPRLTTHISIPARYLVLIPDSEHVGISLRIEDPQERDRLKEMLEHLIEQTKPNKKYGFILRTVAEGVGEEELLADMQFLHRLWLTVEEQIRESRAPDCVYEDLPLHLRTIRDFIKPSIEKIRIDSLDTYNKVCQFVRKIVPHLEDRVEYYIGERPLFDFFGVEDEISRAMGRQVQLKSGGYLILEQTEAMTTIDVNTGGFVGHRNLEETILTTNLEAAAVIARQLRLRNLGGIIIIDFIDMEDVEHKREVQRTLENGFERNGEQGKINILGVSELGLIEMTRKRTRESLEHTLCETCPTCNGRGRLKTATTVCCEIFREIMREAKKYEHNAYLVLASETVVNQLLDEESGNVTELEGVLNKTIRFQVEPSYSQEQFDVVLV